LADPQSSLPPDPVAGLIDIPLPQQTSLLPQTWPARIALALLLAAIVVASWRLVRHWRTNRYRREALAELEQITQTPSNELATRLSLLVRRTALAAFPREQVAPLSGTAWLAFLDRTSGETEFSRGPGRWLASAPYARAAPGDSQRLIELTRRWIRRHHA
jgi:Ca-activated chloride channel family protein